MKMNRGRMSFGLWLILIGAILVLNNLGWLDWKIWVALFDLWPVLLILWGAHLLLSRTFLWFVPVLAGVVIVGAVALSGPDMGLGWLAGDQVSESFRYEIDPNKSRFEVRVNVGAVDFTMKRGEPGIVAGELTSPEAIAPTARFQEWGSGADLLLQPDQRRGWWFSRLGASEWSVEVPEAIPLVLRVNGGAGDFLFDMRGLDVPQITLNGGASHYKLLFDEVGSHTQVNVNGGFSSLDLEVSSDVGLRIRINGVMIDHNLERAGLRQNGRWWETPGYAQSARTVDLDLSLSFGSLNVVRD